MQREMDGQKLGERRMSLPRLVYALALGVGMSGLVGCPSQPKPAEFVLKETPAEAPMPFDFAPSAEGNEGQAGEGEAQRYEPRSAPKIEFVDVHSELSLNHVYDPGTQGDCLFVETIGGGGGWLDYDNDGWPDVYLNQGGNPTSHELTEQPTDVLFRNLDGEHFQAIEHSFVVERNYSQGVSVADFNNDGFDDVYVTNVGRNTMWLNCGDGTFEEVAEIAGVDDALWSVSAAWMDIDRDGDLDLYVANYCDYDPRHPQECLDRQGRPTICNPANVPPAPDHFFRNVGDGTFVECANELGLVGTGNRALGVAIANFTEDALPDIYVANDTTDNFLFVQQDDGSFEDQAQLRGCAVNRGGQPESSMGLAIADFDRNGKLDIYSTHFLGESNTLYANEGEYGFRDVTALTSLHAPSLPFLGFGAVFSDFNADGFLELIVANGHVDHSQRADDPQMRPQLFSYDGVRHWHDLSDSSGEYFRDKKMGRACAEADFDRDGDTDILIVNEGDPAAMLRNDTDSGASSAGWLRLRFRGVASNRRGIGCEARVIFAGDTQFQQLVGGSSFAAAREPVMTFGFPRNSEELPQNPVAKVEVLWPSGIVQDLELALDQEYVLEEPSSR